MSIFIRERYTKTKNYGRTVSRQVIETFRKNGKVCQRVLCNLGKQENPGARIAYLQNNIIDAERAIIRWQQTPPRDKEERLADLRQRIHAKKAELKKIRAVVSRMRRAVRVSDTTNASGAGQPSKDVRP